MQILTHFCVKKESEESSFDAASCVTPATVFLPDGSPCLHIMAFMSQIRYTIRMGHGFVLQSEKPYIHLTNFNIGTYLGPPKNDGTYTYIYTLSVYQIIRPRVTLLDHF